MQSLLKVAKYSVGETVIVVNDVAAFARQEFEHWVDQMRKRVWYMTVYAYGTETGRTGLMSWDEYYAQGIADDLESFARTLKHVGNGHAQNRRANNVK